ncbi:MAG: hypothetical protein IJN64_00020 [Lachnospiraceae bacterium]|nr:hypothetical protein [Lachnospiraceae bacterium]
MAKNLWKNMKKGLCGTMAVMLCVGTMGTLTVTAAPTNTFEDVEESEGTSELGNIVKNETELPIPVPAGVKRVYCQVPLSFFSNKISINGVMEFNESGNPTSFLNIIDAGAGIKIGTVTTVTTVYEYDSLGRLVSSYANEVWDVGQRNYVTTLSYNMNNQVESVRIETSSSYTSINSYDYDYEDYNYQYDEKGNMISKTRKHSDYSVVEKHAWSYVYDEQGRMIEKCADVAVDGVYKYVYNADGSYVEMCLTSGQNWYYDADDKLLAGEYRYGSDKYSYNAQGLLSSTCEIMNGHEINRTYNYEYDELGRIISLNIFKDKGVRGKGTAYYTFEY